MASKPGLLAIEIQRVDDQRHTQSQVELLRRAGLPKPALYLPQLKNLSDPDTFALMRGNLARFLGLPA